ncbi:MAG: hypothetical protein ACXWLL_04620 [Myxococcaceae bacterium]
METLPVDLTQLVASTMAMLLVLIPVLGLAVRFAARPIVEALLATKGEAARPADLESLKVRIDALEHEVKELSAPGVARPSFSDPRPVPIRP